MNALLNLAIDTGAQPPVSTMKLFSNPPVLRIGLGEQHTILATCGDGCMLACLYLPVQTLLHLMRRNEHLPLFMRLAERSPWSYLLLDGNLRCSSSGKAELDGDRTGFDWSAVQGLLLSIQELGIGIVTLQDTKHLGDTIYGLAKRDRSTRRVRPPREALWVSPAEDLLMALPGIGDERCGLLLRHCGGSAAIALDALTDPKHAVPGIGPETKRNIRAALGLSETTYLALSGLPVEEPQPV